MKKALWVLGMVMAAFVVAHDIGFENGFIALAGAAVMLLLYTMGLPHTQSDEKVEDVRGAWTGRRCSFLWGCSSLSGRWTKADF